MQETQEMWVRSLGQEDPLEKGMATHSHSIAWRIPWKEEPGGLQSIRSQRVVHDWSNIAHMHKSRIYVYNQFLPSTTKVLKYQVICNGKDSGKDWRQWEKQTTEDEMVGWHHWLSGTCLSKLWEIVKDRETWHAVVHGIAKSRTWLSNWTQQ